MEIRRQIIRQNETILQPNNLDSLQPNDDYVIWYRQVFLLEKGGREEKMSKSAACSWPYGAILSVSVSVDIIRRPLIQLRSVQLIILLGRTRDKTGAVGSRKRKFVEESGRGLENNRLRILCFSSKPKIHVCLICTHAYILGIIYQLITNAIVDAASSSELILSIIG